MSVSQYYTSLFDVHISKNQSHLTTTILSLPVPSKHLKGQLGPASVTSRFWMKARQLGPASVTSHFLDQSTSVGARFCNVMFFESKQVSWIPLSVTSGFWTKADWIPLLVAFHKCKKKRVQIQAERLMREVKRWEHTKMYLPDCILALRSC